MKTHKDLIVWQKSIDFVTELYRETSNFPKDEQYGLVNQMRRAAISIPSNIAEGAARNSDKELVRFLHIARASASELETQLLISENLEYLIVSQNTLKENLIEISKMLTNLIYKINQRIDS
jgi:four helix bundle protein